MARRFKPVAVGPCRAQTAVDRFGDGARAALRDRERLSMGMAPQAEEIPFVWPGQGPDTEDEVKSIYGRIPSMQLYRNNLTALSQTCNLYFAAYQGRIFVYSPRSIPSQVLPRDPDLQLIPKQSHASHKIGGTLDRRRPHTVNHLITGFLGTQEIVLACYDNGDVVAYYVKDIADSIARRRHGTGAASRGNGPDEFFHDNVGISAWGLAVHQKSRLIAVSSNYHEVTVFAFGLGSDGHTVRDCMSDAALSVVEGNVRKRARNWRIIVLFGKGVDNIPNICFVDDAHGYAEKVCGVDIRGVMWLGDIWKMRQAPIRIPPLNGSRLKSEEAYSPQPRGWGVLPLPDSSFLEVSTLDELFGMASQNVVSFASRACHVASIDDSLKDIPGNPCPSEARPQTVHRNALPIPNLIQALQNGTFVEGLGNLEDLIGDNGAGLDDEESDEDSVMDADDLLAQHGTIPEGDVLSAEEDEEIDDEDDENAGEQGIGANEGLANDTTQIETPAPAVASAPVPNNPILGDPVGEFYTAAFASLGEALEDLEQAFNAFHGEFPGEWVPCHPMGSRKTHNATSIQRKLRGRPEERNSDSYPTRLDMIYYPHSGVVDEAPRGKKRLGFFSQPNPPNGFSSRGVEALEKYGNRFHLLRTYERDVELCGFGRDEETGEAESDVLCSGVVSGAVFTEHTMRHHFAATGRLSMMAHVPELSLVVIGSPTGRVVLLTLTRTAQPSPQQGGYWQHGFRVEWILPFKADEELHRKALRPLHGMAVGPVQVQVGGCAGSKTGLGLELPRRYRLMLHYRNHDILTYELTREEQTRKLCIF